jgi:hypothetical protein
MGQIVKSQHYSISDFSGPLALNFKAMFGSDMSAVKNDAPIVINITSVTNKDRDENVVGTNNYQQTLFAQAILDSRLELIFSGDFISSELIPCQSDDAFASSESPGVLFLRIARSKSLGVLSPQERLLIER